MHWRLGAAETLPLGSHQMAQPLVVWAAAADVAVDDDYLGSRLSVDEGQEEPEETREDEGRLVKDRRADGLRKVNCENADGLDTLRDCGPVARSEGWSASVSVSVSASAFVAATAQVRVRVRFPIPRVYVRAMGMAGAGPGQGTSSRNQIRLSDPRTGFGSRRTRV
jgi:hypothetical protein